MEQCYCNPLHTVFLGIDNFVTHDIQDVLITSVIQQPEKFLQFAWLRAEVFQLNLKNVHVKIAKSCNNLAVQVMKKLWKDFQILKSRRFKN